MNTNETRAALVSFGKHFRAVQVSANMSQRELARRAKVGREFISEIELGMGNPSLATIVLLADGLGCELADLFPKRSA